MNNSKSFTLKILHTTIRFFWRLFPKRFKLVIMDQRVTDILDYSTKKIKLIVSSSVSTQRLNSCKKEPKTVEWITSNLDKAGVFYDIGSNTGAYSLIAATLLNDSGRVVSFEPVPGTFSELCQNILINRLDKQIVPLNIALNEKNGIMKFGLNSFTNGVGEHMGISTEAKLSNNSDVIFHYLIKTYTLDFVVSEFKLPLPTLIKLDVDGLEFVILKGAKSILSSKTLRSLQIEIDQINQPVDDILLFLKSHNLKLKEKNRHGDSDIYDYVFFK
jgi:FkbM family methyltransferase